MKYITFLLLAIISIALSTSLTTETKSSSKAQTKMVTKLGSSSYNNDNSMGPSRSKSAKKGKKSKIIKIKRKKYSNPIQVLKSGWLKVSSTMFKHTGRFPPIVLPSGKEIKILVNRKYFRINQSYKKGADSSKSPPNKKYFWFRLSGKNLYYSMTTEDINVLGVVSVKNIVDSYASKDLSTDKNCFKILDREGRNWTLCSESQESRKRWICKIKEMLGFIDKSCTTEGLADNDVTVITRIVTQPVILIPLPSPKCNENWDYTSKGGDWNCECADGNYNFIYILNYF